MEARTGIRGGRPARRGGERGFTLIELIVVAVLIGILAMVAATPLLAGLRARKEVADDLDAIAKLRYATERIAREIRQVQYDSITGYRLTLQNAATRPRDPDMTDYPATIQSSTGVCITRWSAAGTTSTAVLINRVLPSVKVTYGGTACPASGTATDLVDNVSDLKLDFLGIDITTGAVTAPLVSDGASFYTNVRFVDITLTLTQPGGTLSQRTRVALRNGKGP
jgi:prepilin-type N-terminal cleavage/methylation domain-containing protein